MSLEHSLLRDRDVRALLVCSRSTLWRRVKDGSLPTPVKIGGTNRFVSSEIQAAIDQAMAAREDV
ncbi:MAG: DNA-binding protein [Paracoccaceae bacterium]|nr:DNA-binding protein [Paracoccaceae bacterium]